MIAGLTSSQGGIVVNPAFASHFVITGPSGVAAGTLFSITVTALDNYGNVACMVIGRGTSLSPRALVLDVATLLALALFPHDNAILNMAADRATCPRVASSFPGGSG